MGDETPDGVPDELADFWQVARVRAGLGKVAAVTGPGVTATMVPPTWSFGDGPELADRLLALVLDGVKTATAGAEVEYAQSGEPLPVKGDVSIVVDSAGHPGALIRTTRVDVVPFDAVDDSHAYAEGEGDRTLATWRAEHERYWRRTLGPAFAPDLRVVLERFELLYPRASDR
jgi:uncharacterized protein YhfF